MPHFPNLADTASIALVNGRHITVHKAIADRVRGIDSDGDLVVTLSEPGRPMRHKNGSDYLIPLTPCCHADGKGSESATGVVCRSCYREVDIKYGTHTTVAVVRDMTGLLVRWEFAEQWITARVADIGTLRNSWRGEVVDTGNYVGLNSDLFGPETVRVGQWLHNLHLEYLTVISDQQPSDS